MAQTVNNDRKPDNDPTSNQQTQQDPIMSSMLNTFGEPDGFIMTDANTRTAAYDFEKLLNSGEGLNKLAWKSNYFFDNGISHGFVIPPKDMYVARELQRNQLSPDDVYIMKEFKHPFTGEITKEQVRNPQYAPKLNEIEQNYASLENSYDKFMDTKKMLYEDKEFNISVSNLINNNYLGVEDYGSLNVQDRKIDAISGNIIDTKKEPTPLGVSDAEMAKIRGQVWDVEKEQWEDWNWWNQAGNSIAGVVWSAGAAYKAFGGVFESLVGGNADWLKYAVPSLGSLFGIADVLYGQNSYEGIMPTPKMYNINYDENGAFIEKRDVTDRRVTNGQILSVFGQGYNDNGFVSFFGNLANEVQPILFAQNIVGASTQWAMDLGDMIWHNENEAMEREYFNSDAYDYSLALQKIATQNSYKPSEQALANGPLGSIDGFSGFVGQMMGQAVKQITLAVLTEGMTLPMAMISLEAASKDYIAMNDMAMQRDVAVARFPVIFGITFGIEKAIGPSLEYSTSSITRTATRKGIIGAHINKNVQTGIGAFYGRVLSGQPKNMLEFGLMVGGEEGLEELIQGRLEKTVNVFSDMWTDYLMSKKENEDWYINNHEKGYLPKDSPDRFYEMTAGDNYYDVWTEHLWDDWAIETLGGLLSGPGFMLSRKMYGLKSYDPNVQEQTIDQAVLNGQGEGLYTTIGDLEKHAKFGRLDINMAGERNTGQPGWKSENSQKADLIRQDIERAEAAKAFFTESTIEAIGGSFNLSLDAMKIGKKIVEVNEEIEALNREQIESSGSESPIDNTKIIEQKQQEIKDLNEKLDLYIKPTENGKSQKYNEYLDGTIATTVLVRNFTDYVYSKAKGKDIKSLTKEDYASNEYIRTYMKVNNNIKNLALDGHEFAQTKAQNVKEYQEYLKLEQIEKGKSVINKVLDAESGLQFLVDNLKKKQLSKSDLNTIIASVNSELTKIGSTANEFKYIRLNSKNVAEGEVSQQTHFNNIIESTNNLVSKLDEYISGQKYKGKPINELLEETTPDDVTSNTALPGAKDSGLYEDDILSSYSQLKSSSEFLQKGEIDLSIEKVNKDKIKYYEKENAKSQKSIDEIDKKLNDKKLSEEEKKSLENQKKSILDDINGNNEKIDNIKAQKSDDPEIFAEYFGRYIPGINTIKDIIKKGIKNTNEKGEKILKDINDNENYLHKALALAKLNAFGSGMFFNSSKEAKKLYDEKRHSMISIDEYLAIEEKYISLLDELDALKGDLMRDMGITNHMVTEALEARLKIAFYRDMFTGKSTDTHEAFIDRISKLGIEQSDYEELITLINYITDYSVKNGKNVGKYDLSDIDIDQEVYNDGGQNKGLLSDKGIKDTKELISKISMIESILNKHSDKIFTQDNVNLFVHNLNEWIHSLQSRIDNNSIADGFLGDFEKSFGDSANSHGSGYGYMQSKFEDAENGYDAISLLKLAVKKNINGEVSLLATDESSTGSKDNRNNKRFCSPKVINNFTYKYAINYLTQLSSLNSKKNYETHISILNDAKNELNVPITFEQMHTIAQVESFFNGGNKVFQYVLQSEAEYFGTAYDKMVELHKSGKRKLTKRTNFSSNDVYKTKILKRIYGEYIPNGIFVTGKYGSGKSSLIPLFINRIIANDEILQEKIKNKKAISITVSANTDNLINDNADRIIKYFEAKGIKININKVNSRDINNSKSLGDIVILDEATLLLDKNFTSDNNGLNQLFSGIEKTNSKLIMVGDESQVSSSTSFSTPPVSRICLQTIPITTSYRSGLQITNIIADHFQKHIKGNSENLANGLPISNFSDNNGIKQGVEYIKASEMVLIVDKFVDDINNGNQTVKKALIVPTMDYMVTNYKVFKSILKKDGNKYIVDPKYSNSVYTIVDDFAKEKDVIDSIQGLPANHLYIAVDWRGISRLNGNDKGISTALVSKMMYTAISRVGYDSETGSNYVAVIENPMRIDKTKKELLTVIDKKSERDIDTEITYLNDIVSGNIEQKNNDINSKVDKSKDDKEKPTVTNQYLKTHSRLIEQGMFFTGEVNDRYFYSVINENGSISRISLDKNGVELSRTIEYGFKKNKADFSLKIKYDKGQASRIDIKQGKNTTYLYVNENSNLKNIVKSIEVGNLTNEQLLELLSGASQENKSYKDIHDALADSEFVFDTNDIKLSALEITDDKWKQGHTSYAKTFGKTYQQEVIDIIKTGEYQVSINPSGVLEVENNGYIEYNKGEFQFTEIKNNGEENTITITQTQALDLISNTLFKKSDLYQRRLFLNKGKDIKIEELESENISVEEESNSAIYNGYTIIVGNIIPINGNNYRVSNIRTLNGETKVTVVNNDNKETVYSLSNFVSIIDDSLNIDDKTAILNGEDPNIIKTEEKVSSQSKKDLKDSGAIVPTYFYGRAVKSFAEFLQLPIEERMKISYIIQTIKQDLLRTNGYSNMHIVLTKNRDYITDDGGSITSNFDIEFVGDTVLTKSQKDKYLKKYGGSDYSNEIKAKIFESVNSISVSENYGFFDDNGILNSKESIIDDIKEKYEDDTAIHIIDSIEALYSTVENFDKSGDNEMILGNNFPLSIKRNHSLQESETMVTGSEFISEQLNRMFSFSGASDIVYEGKHKIQFKFSSLYGTTATVFGLPKKVSSIGVWSYYKGLLIDDLKKKLEESFSDHKNKGGRLSAMNNSLFFQFLMSNKSLLNSEKGKAFAHALNNLVVFEDNDGRIGVKLNSKSSKLVDEKNALNDLISYLEKLKDYNMFPDFRVYVPRVNSEISSNNFDLIEFSVSGINATGIYLDLAKNIKSDNVSKNNTTLRNNRKGPGDVVFMEQTLEETARLIALQEFDDYFKRALGDSYNDMIDLFDGEVFGRRVWGYYHKGRIGLRVDENGKVNTLTPRHEVGHYVFDNMTENNKQRAYFAGRQIMKSEKYKNMSEEEVDNLSDIDVEHFIVQRYATKAEVDTTFGTSILFGGLLNKIKKLINRLFNVFHDSYLNDLFYSIENGKYANLFNSDLSSDPVFMADEDISIPVQDNSEDNIIPNRSYSKIHNKRKLEILKSLGHDVFLFKTAEKYIMWCMMSNTHYSNNNSTKTIQEVAADVRKNFPKDLIDYKEDEEIEVQVGNIIKKFKDIEPNELQLLSHNDIMRYVEYVSLINSDFFVDEIMGKEYGGNNWERFSQKAKERSIDQSLDSVFDLVLSNIPYYEYNGNDFVETTKFINVSELKRILKDHSTDTLNILRSKSNPNNDNIIEAFKDVLRDIHRGSQSSLRDPYYRSHVASLYKYIESIETRLNQYDSRFNTNDILSTAEKNTYIHLNDLLNRVSSIIISTWNKTGIEYVYDNKILTIKKLHSNRLTKLKDKIKSDVAAKTMNGEFISDSLSIALQGGKVRGRSVNRFLDVNKEGVNFIAANGDIMPLIINDKGNYRFSDYAKTSSGMTQVRLLFDQLGIRIRPTNLYKYVNNVNSDFGNILLGKIKGVSMKSQNNNQAIAEMIYGIVSSANQWAIYKNEMKSLISDKNEYGEDITNAQKNEFDEKEMKLRDKLNSGSFDSSNQISMKVTAGILTKFGMNDNPDSYIDAQEVTDENIGGEEILKYYKPTDFWKLYEAFAELEISSDNRYNSPLLYDNAGNKIPSNGMKSMFIDMAENNFEPSTVNQAELLNMVNEHSVDYIIKDGIPVKVTPIGNTDKGFSISDVDLVFSWQENNTVTTPEACDLIRTDIDNYVKSALEQGKKGRLRMSISDIADRTDVYSYSVVTDAPLVSMEKDKDGNVTANINTSEVVKRFEYGLDYYKHGSEVIMKKIADIINIHREKKIDSNVASGSNFNYNNVNKFIKLVNEVLSSDEYAVNKNHPLVIALQQMNSGIDYNIVDNKIVVGNGVLFNHSIWSVQNYDAIKSKNSVNDKMNTIFNLLHSNYMNFTKVLSNKNYNLPTEYIPERFKNSYEKYYKQEGKNIYDYNDITYSFFLTDILHRAFLDQAIIGDFRSINSQQKKSKRLAPITSPSLVATFQDSDPNKRIKKFRVLIVKDRTKELELYNNVKKIQNVDDGQSIGTLLGKIITDRGFGGQFSGEKGNLKKTLLVGKNMNGGYTNVIKHAAIYTSDDDFKNSPEIRQWEKLILDDISRKVNEEIGDDAIKYDFHNMFITHYKKTGNAETAAQLLFNDMYFDRYSKVILNNIILQTSTESAVKTQKGAYLPFNFGDVKSVNSAFEGQVLPTVDFSTDGLRLITNLTQDVSDMEDNVLIMNQLISQASELDNKENKYSPRINSIITEIRNREYIKLNTAIAKKKLVGMSIEEALLDYMKELAQSGVMNIENATALNTVLNDPRLSLKLPLVTEDLLRIYRSHLNNSIIKIRMNGFRGSIQPGNDVGIYELEGTNNYYSLSDIEKYFDYEYNYETSTNEIIKITQGDKELIFNRKSLSPMKYEGDILIPTEYIMANPLLNYLKMDKTESLKSMYMYNIGNEYIDLQGKSANDIATFITNDIFIKIKSGQNISGYMPDSDLLLNHIVFRNDTVKTSVRLAIELMDKLQEIKVAKAGEFNTLEKRIKEEIEKMYTSINKSTNVMEVRIPTGTLGQSVMGIIKEFTANDNNVKMAMENSIYKDDDADGDQSQFYIKYIDENEIPMKADGTIDISKMTTNQLKNSLLDVIHEAYADKNNIYKINVSSDVSNLRGSISKFVGKEESDIHTYAGTISSYESAKRSSKAIGLFAAMKSLFGELEQGGYGIFTKSYFTSENYSVSRNVGNWLQIALDSFNHIGIGTMNVPEIAIPLLTAYLVDFNGNIKSYETLNKYAISFFTDDVVKEILNKASKSMEISQYPKYNALLSTIYDEMIKYSEVAQKDDNGKMRAFTKAEIDYYSEQVVMLTAETKDQYAKLKDALNKIKMNGMWTLIKNPKALEKLVESSDEIDGLYEEMIKLKSKDKLEINAYKASIINKTILLIEEFDEVNKSSVEISMKNADDKFTKIIKEVDAIKKSIDENYADKRAYANAIKVYNKKEKSEELYRIAIKGEQLRRASRFIDLRNGIPTMSNEFKSKKIELSNYIGGDIADLYSMTWTEDGHIDWFKAHNNDILKSSSPSEINKLIQIETAVIRAFNNNKNKNLSLVDILCGPEMKKYRTPIKLLSRPYFQKDSPLVIEHKIFDDVEQRYIATLFSNLTKKQRINFDNVKKAYIIDRYFKLSNQDAIDVSPYNYTFEDDGYTVSRFNEGTPLNNIDLTKAIERNVYERAFVQYMDNLIELTKVPTDLIKTNDANLFILLDAFKSNRFLSKYVVMGRNNKRYMALDAATIMSDEEKNLLQKEFAKLPDELKDMIFNYELIRNGFRFKAGRAYDVMPSEMFYAMSDLMPIIEEELTDNFNDSNKKEQFISRFVEHLLIDKEGLPYLSYENAEASEMNMKKKASDEVLRLKSLPGDGTNTTGNSKFGLQKYTDYETDRTYNLTVNQKFDVYSVILGSYNYESDSDIEMSTRERVIRSIPIDKLLSIYEAFKNGEQKTFIEQLEYANQTSLKDGRYMTEIGVPIYIKSSTVEGNVGRVFSVKLSSLDAKRNIFNIAMKGRNAMYEEMGGIKSYNIDHISSFEKIFESHIPIIMSNSLGYPNTKTDRLLFGMTNNNQYVDARGLDSKHGDVGIVNTEHKGTYRVSINKVSEIKKNKADRVYLQNDKTPFTYDEVKENIYRMMETISINSDKQYMFVAEFDKDVQSNVLVNENGEIKTKALSKKMIYEMIADYIVENSELSFNNFIISNSSQASILNEILYNRGYLKTDIKFIDEIKRTEVSDNKVNSILLRINKKELNRFVAENKIDIDNLTVEGAAGLEYHLSKSVTEKVSLSNIRADVKAFGVAEALYYVYSNNNYSLIYNQEGLNSLLYKSLLKEINNPILALKIKASMFNQKTSGVISGMLSMKYNIKQNVGMQVEKFTILDLKQMIDANKVQEECIGGGIPIAANGLALGFTAGGIWSLVEDLKGPTHSQGGIDLYFGEDGAYINGEIKAENGLVISNDN